MRVEGEGLRVEVSLSFCLSVSVSHTLSLSLSYSFSLSLCGLRVERSPVPCEESAEGVQSPGGSRGEVPTKEAPGEGFGFWG